MKGLIRFAVVLVLVLSLALPGTAWASDESDEMFLNAEAYCQSVTTPTKEDVLIAYSYFNMAETLEMLDAYETTAMFSAESAENTVSLSAIMFNRAVGYFYPVFTGDGDVEEAFEGIYALISIRCDAIRASE